MSTDQLSMPHKPFTLRVFFPDGDPNGPRVIDDNNWTGRAVCINRDDINNDDLLTKLEIKNEPGIYVLVGELDENVAETELTTQLYVGETDNLAKRLKEHADKRSSKDFWHLAISFFSTKGALSKGHCLWLERQLIIRANKVNRSIIENGTTGSDARLTSSERADCELFLDKVYQIFPLAGVQAFEEKEGKPRRLVSTVAMEVGVPDTIVVPARDEGFKRVFLGEDCWYSIRISKDRIGDLKYIAGYRVGKIRQVTHFAEIKEIVPYGDAGKYKVIFKSKAQKLGEPVPYITGTDSSLQASRYTYYEKLSKAKSLTELFDLGAGTTA